jgi:hypothetical protein
MFSASGESSHHSPEVFLNARAAFLQPSDPATAVVGALRVLTIGRPGDQDEWDAARARQDDGDGPLGLDGSVHDGIVCDRDSVPLADAASQEDQRDTEADHHEDAGGRTADSLRSRG